MRRHSPFKSRKPVIVAQGCKVFIGDLVNLFFYLTTNFKLFISIGKSNSRCQTRLNRLIATRPRKYEENCGKQVVVIENVYNLWFAGAINLGGFGSGVATGTTSLWTPAYRLPKFAVVAMNQVLVHSAVFVSAFEEFHQFVTKQNVLVERDRSMLRNHDCGVSPNLIKPSSKFFGV
jgi:hypothetical protein